MKRTISKYAVPFIAAATFVCLSNPVSAAEPVFTPEGAVQSLTAADFWSHPHKQKNYAEYWTYEIRTDDAQDPTFVNNYSIFVNLFTTNLGISEGRCGADVSIIKSGVEERVYTREKPLKQFHELKDKQEIWCSDYKDPNAEKIFIQGVPPEKFDKEARHRLSMEIRKNDGVFLDLTFGRLVPGVKQGDGVFRFNKDKSDELGVFFTIPRARIKGTIKFGYDKKTGNWAHTYNVSGWAYQEHYYQTMLPVSFVSRRNGIRVHGENNSLAVFQLVGNKKFGGLPMGWVLTTDKEKVLTLTSDFELKAALPQNETGDYKVATKFTLKTGPTAVGSAAEGGFTLSSYMQRFAMIDQIDNAAARQILKALIGNPIFFRAANSYEFKLTVEGQPVELKGSGVHEVLAAEK